MILVIETTSLARDSRTTFIDALEPIFALSSETPWEGAETTIFVLVRRDGKEMTVKNGRDATLAAFGAGVTVLRSG